MKVHAEQLASDGNPDKDPEGCRIVVIGASAGGVAALLQLFSRIPPSLNAVFLVVQHVGAHKSRLPEIIAAKSSMSSVHPRDGEKLRSGVVYVAPPDFHMVVQTGCIRLMHSPKENHTRPAIDPLFRSAALAYGNRVVGTILTGYLDDGTAGLDAIKRCGGTTLVQDPDEAYAPEMPSSALANVDIDYCGTLEQLAGEIFRLTRQTPIGATVQRPDDIAIEHMASLGEGNMAEHLEKIGRPSGLVCPDCGGALWSLGGSRSPRYRCHTGHAYSFENLCATQAETVETSMWKAIRALQDQQSLMQCRASLFRENGRVTEAEDADALSADLARQVTTLERMVESVNSRLPLVP